MMSLPPTRPDYSQLFHCQKEVLHDSRASHFDWKLFYNSEAVSLYMSLYIEMKIMQIDKVAKFCFCEEFSLAYLNIDSILWASVSLVTFIGNLL